MKIISKIADRIRPLTDKLLRGPLSRINTWLRPLLKYLRIDTDDRAGLYLTLIVHLLLIIVLLSWSIHTQLARDTSFLIDFSEQEAQEAMEARAQMQESVSEELEAELEALLNASRNQSAQSIRNVAVDASEPLRDDRHDHPEDIYREARELQERLDQSRREMEQAADDPDNLAIYEEEDSPAEAYRGPSVISYTLDGRKAMSLPVPAYKCMGGGDVSVSVVVNRKGYVVDARIIESVSSTDQCLREYALRAASGSRFTASSGAPERQVGEIVYRFIAQ